MCRMLAVYSELYEDGLVPRPGEVLFPEGEHLARVKLSLSEQDTRAIRVLGTISGTSFAEVTVPVYDALSDADRAALFASLKASPAQSSRGVMWAEWPARPNLGIPVVGSVGGKDLTQSEVAANRQMEPAQPGKDPTGQPLHTTANPDPNVPAGDVPAAAPGSPAAPRS